MVDYREYGICRLCLVNVRTEPGENRPLLTQLLFGEHYTVHSYDHDREWLHIEQFADGSQGWIRADQHFMISEAYFHQVSTSDYKVSLDTCSTILFRKNNISILLGSVLPISTTELFKMEEQLAYNGESKSMSQKRDSEYFMEILKKYYGAPYLAGGKSPMGIDDAGLLQQALKIAGYKVHRQLDQQERQGERVASFDDIQIGDVVFYQNAKSTKLMIWTGNNEVVRISGYVQKVKLEQSEIPFIKSIKRYIKA